MVLELTPKKIFRLNIYFILLLLCANIIGIIIRFYFGNYSILALFALFDFNIESNVPTFFSSINLLVVSFLLFYIVISLMRLKKSYMQWLILSIIFLYLTIDEFASIHEKFGTLTKEIIGPTSGLLHYAWIIPYSIGLFVFLLAYSKFLLRLPKNILNLFLVSGVIFIFGAIGFEMLGGWRIEIQGEDIIYSLFYTCEEFFEMLGIAIFIYTLLTYIIISLHPIKISIIEK